MVLASSRQEWLIQTLFERLWDPIGIVLMQALLLSGTSRLVVYVPAPAGTPAPAAGLSTAAGSASPHTQRPAA
jgi:hypothetical protein